ncbi:PREDICTED: putative pentatricopeptide repeat-containing protein At1g74400 isoform X2 [Tarenaya hassleriana]|uniref:putative pentatricopeptide repeat-containing protein At1g74400 isoform X2 n=1 Tax=Tarenaya hassleriana TaxID=28532 RepID=UPI00053C6432|nr:PREDICTED: putative pentatricopeptide repeat-containing protein At1g74400 isoform X2 [Tarenaya hassleriana]
MRFLLRHSPLKSLSAVHKSDHFLLNYHSKSNETLRCFLRSNKPIKALLHFRHRFRQNPSFVDSFSVLFAIKASTQKPSPFSGKQCYSVAGNIADARQVFDETHDKKNAVMWTAIIAAYVENGKPGEAIELFRRMEAEKIELDVVIVTVALSACADLGALEMGKRIHSYVQGKSGFAMDLSLRNALIDMYVKCGDIEKARKFFNGTKRKDVTTWTSMIIGHALNGQAEEALELFSKMKAADQRMPKICKNSTILPNDVTFIGVLMACSHAGLVEEGKQHFRSMVEEYNLKPRDAHFGCMVDTFCRAGLLKDAYEFIMNIPTKPNAVIWRTLLGACSVYGNIELGEEVQRKLVELDHDHVGDCIALSNIYASKGMWEKKTEARDRVTKRRVPGKSWIEFGTIMNEFVSGDDDHPKMGEICEILKCLALSTKSYDCSTGS